ncbi:MAG: L-histidine N(alpha)-methyltransferase [Candidatus Moranbacteria bacterium]|nr:L-histidine N(alpha)-methyltransferase [Candidatus Moranbacteria bacterium]
MVKFNQELAKRLTKEQLDILRQYVEEKNEIPIRVVYTQEYWDKIAKDSDYQLANREISALKKSISRLSKQIGENKINIIHLGVGNGFEAPIIIDGLNKNNIVNYSIVDVNPTMLEIAENELHQKCSSIKVKKFPVDIETYGIKNICEETRKDGTAINVICLVANGVLFSNEELVQEIFDNMNNDDYFFLTLELYQKGKDEEIIQSYLIPSVLDLLSNGIRIIGFEPKYEEFSAEMDKNDNMLKVYYSPNTDKTKRFLVLHSYKPSIEQLNERMNNFGFIGVFCEEYLEIHTSAGLFRK